MDPMSNAEQVNTGPVDLLDDTLNETSPSEDTQTPDLLDPPADQPWSNNEPQKTEDFLGTHASSGSNDEAGEINTIQNSYVDNPFDDHESAYVDNPFDNHESAYVDNPFDDEQDEVSDVQQHYVDNPFDDREENDAFLDNIHEENDGIFIDEDSKYSSAPSNADLDSAIGVMYGDDGTRASESEDVTLNKEPPKRRRIRRLRLRRKDKQDTALDRRRRRRLIWALLCCCMLLLLFLMIAGFIIGFGEDSDDPAGDDNFDDDENLDDDWTVYKPFEGITTTPMDPFDENDCDFSDNVFPHVKAQCKCFREITIVPDDVAALKQEVHSEVNREIYNGEYFPEPNSCDPANQALVWLSSGDTRDSGDFFQRYILTTSHLTLNGTNWDLHNEWMSESNECIWIGIQCNSRFQVHNFASDANNLK